MSRMSDDEFVKLFLARNGCDDACQWALVIALSEAKRAREEEVRLAKENEALLTTLSRTQREHERYLDKLGHGAIGGAAGSDPEG